MIIIIDSNKAEKQIWHNKGRNKIHDGVNDKLESSTTTNQKIDLNISCNGVAVLGKKSSYTTKTKVTIVLYVGERWHSLLSNKPTESQAKPILFS